MSGTRPTETMNRANDTTQDGPTAIDTRFRARESADGRVEIFDSENEDAWIRSDYTLEVAGPN